MGRAGKAVVAAILGAGAMSLAAPANAATVIVVGPSDNVQRAVSGAPAGAVVVLKPGVYRQSLLLRRGDIEIRGSGASDRGTVLEPSTGPIKNACQRAGNGICVLDLQGHTTVTNVTIDNLLVRNFADSGIVAFGARNLNVYNVTSHDNGGYGIARFATSGGQLVHNIVYNNGEAGLYVGDSPHSNAFVAGNTAYGNQFGMLLRHAQHARILYNTFQGNCVGLMVVSAPAPVGDSVVEFNTFRHNNKSCPAVPGELPFPTQGTGIALIGTVGMMIDHNAIYNNAGTSPVSGGVTLVDGSPLGGPPSSGNTVTQNTMFGNSPADIVDHSGGTNALTGNVCTSSIPGGLC